MSIEEDFIEINNYAHMWNWLPDWDIAEKIYREFPDSYAVLTPFAYAYLEELIRTLTSDYMIPVQDRDGMLTNKKVGIKLINLAIRENKDAELVKILEEYKKYFESIKITNTGNNRHGVNHGIMHPHLWTQENFENLIHDIARLSKYSRF